MLTFTKSSPEGREFRDDYRSQAGRSDADVRRGEWLARALRQIPIRACPRLATVRPGADHRADLQYRQTIPRLAHGDPAARLCDGAGRGDDFYARLCRGKPAGR